MDIETIIKNLEIAHLPVKKLIEKEDELIGKEAIALAKFVDRIYPFATKKKIHGNHCVLIYVYKGSLNDTISNEVYFSPKGYITYQVFDKETYLGFVPDAEIESGYSKVDIDYFLKTKSLNEIINFFIERPTKLKEQEFKLSENNEKRKKFLDIFTERLEGYL